MKKSNKKPEKVILALLILVVFFSVVYFFARSSEGVYSTAVVKNIEKMPEEYQQPYETAYLVDLEISAGKYRGKLMQAEHYDAPGTAYHLQLSVGDRVLVVIDEHEGQMFVGIEELYKSWTLMYLSLFVIMLIAFIGGKSGIRALFALCATIGIVFAVMSVLLLKGYNPILVTMVTATAVTLVNIGCIVGFSRKGLIALSGTLFGVLCAAIFGITAASMIRLTGYTGSESTYLQVLDSEINLRGILLCGIIIGALGAVMDVAISISSSLLEISIANPGYGPKKLFNSGMNIGRDIIGTMVNTLVLAYAGASLPVILLFTTQREDFPLLKIMNMEFVGAELTRSLAGLVGLALAIPATAYIASKIYSKPEKK